MTKTGTISVNVQCETLNHSVNYADTGGGTVAKDFTLPAGKTGRICPWAQTKVASSVAK